MFKRFQVMHLFHDEDEYEPIKWIDIEERIPNTERGLFKVKLSNGNEVYAYFFNDKAIGLCRFAGIKPTYWWNRISEIPLYDVTHWGEKE